MFMVLLWVLWQERNNFVHGEVTRDSENILDYVGCWLLNTRLLLIELRKLI